MGLFDYTYGGKTKSVGGLLGELWDSFGNNPRNAETVDAMKGMVGLLPLSAGDIASGVLAVDDARRGDYLSAGLNGVGMLPYIPAMGGIIKRGVKIKDLPLDPSAYTAKSLGSQGQQVMLGDMVVGTTKGKLKNATSDFVNELSTELQAALKRSDAAKIAATQRAKNKISSEMLDEAFNANKALIENAHKSSELTFNPLQDSSAFSRGKFIYQSPSYGNKKGSSYRLIDVNGQPAYARESDHWGNFSARSSEDFDKWNDYNWTLPGSTNGQRSIGYILLDDLRRGDYVNATLNGLGALPLVPALGGMISSKGDDVAKAISQVDDYAGLHRPPMKGSGAPLHDLTGGGDFYPDDVYSANGLRYYGTGDDRVDREVWNLAMQVKGKPDAKVKMYRAVPYEKTNAEKIAELEKQKAAFMKRGKVPDNSGFTNGSKWYEWASGEIDRLKNAPESAISPEKINHGDWVTTSRQYAKDHGESALGGNYKILSQTVPARKLFTNGDSWAEFGYDETGRINPQLLPWLVGGGLLGTAGISYYSE